ncbi:MAG TPA: amino acid ABC transporter permease [Anaerolineae bacterium]|nr:amino acid ABC transporter permease [Anaerolineae bacterium]
MTTQTEILRPPRLSVDPVAWLKKNLFSTWYNAVLTILAVLLIGTPLRSALAWATTDARWGAITSNLTLFMVGQYPRDQLWRIWLAIYLLAALIGLSWGHWRSAVRGFAIIALGAAAVFALTAIQSDVWLNWLTVIIILGVSYLGGRRIPQTRRATIVAWVIYFPVSIFLLAGSPAVPGVPPVELSLWGGLLLTLTITVVGNLIALPLGILLALGRRSRLPAVHYFCVGYIELIRGVPLITILYMAANMLPFFLPEGVRPDNVIRALIGFSLFEAAYQAENVRGGLQAIPRGQYEAAAALGFNTTLSTVLIILPQALRIVIPALIGSFISLFKDTSLVAIIGLFDVLRVGRSVLAQEEWLGTHREVFLFAFLIYWGFNMAFSYGSRRLEQASGVGKR